MLLRRVRPSRYLASLMFSWGIINMAMGFVRSYAGLVALRFCLGAFEAGVMPGIVYITSMYYKRHEFQLRMSFFFTSTLVGGAFGGVRRPPPPTHTARPLMVTQLLAYAIAHLGGRAGYGGWRWIFIIEGALTAFVALLSVFAMVDWPEQGRFLNAAERALLRRRLAADGGAERARMDRLDGQAYRLILTDWKIWLGSLVYMGIGTTGYATTFFMPTVLLEFGWAAEAAQVHTIPVYAASAAAMLAVAWASDRLRHRYGFILAGCVTATAGYGLLLLGHQGGLGRGAKYGAVFLVALGGHASTPLALAWLANNVAGHWKRAFAAAIQVTLGNVAGIVAAAVFLPAEAPTYTTGYATALAMLWLGAAAASLLVAGLVTENRRRDRGARDYRLARPADRLNNMGDHHPSFRFTT